MNVSLIMEYVLRHVLTLWDHLHVPVAVGIFWTQIIEVVMVSSQTT